MTQTLDSAEAKLHQETLAALTESDWALAHAPAMAIDEVHRLDQIDKAWLNATLGAGVPGAELLELVDTDAHAGMTDRKKWRLTWNASGEKAGLPGAIFVKATPDSGAHREMLAVLHMDEAEAKFFRQLHPENPGLAPEAYYFRSYGGGRSLIILEDLEARGCRPFWQADHLSLDHARAIAVTQARFHAKYWGTERLAGDLHWVRPRTRRFGWPWLFDAHHRVRQTFLDTATEDQLPPHARSVLQTWHDHCRDLYRHWDTKTLTVIHGDSHIGNTYLRPDGSAGYYDWQVVFAANGLRDLAYFLYSGFTDEQRRNHEQEVFDLYIDTLAECGVRLDREEAWNDFLLFALDRWDAGMMSFVHGTYNHARSAQLRQFAAVAGAIADHDIAGRLAAELRRLR